MSKHDFGRRRSWVGRFLSTRVVVVDDVADIRWLLRAALNADDRFEVVGEAADGLQAVAVVDLTRPDVVVLDLMMPVMDGLEAAEEIARRTPETRVVIYSALDAEALGVTIERAPAVAILKKGATRREIVETVAHAAGSGVAR